MSRRDGTYLGSSLLVIQGLLDPATVEEITCREALALVDDLGICHPFVASDRKLVVDYIQKGVEEALKKLLKRSGKFFYFL